MKTWKLSAIALATAVAGCGVEDGGEGLVAGRASEHALEPVVEVEKAEDNSTSTTRGRIAGLDKQMQRLQGQRDADGSFSPLLSPPRHLKLPDPAFEGGIDRSDAKVVSRRSIVSYG